MLLLTSLKISAVSKVQPGAGSHMCDTETGQQRLLKDAATESGVWQSLRRRREKPEARKPRTCGRFGASRIWMLRIHKLL